MQVTSYKPVIITSNRTVTMQHRDLRELKRQLGGDCELLPIWMAATVYKQQQVAPLISGIIRGEFEPEQVEETETELRIHDPRIFMPLRVEMVLDEAWRDRARQTLVSDLTGLGHRVAIITPDPEEFAFASPNVLGELEAAGVAKNDIIPLPLIDNEHPGGSMVFPRDMFTELDGTVYICPGEHNLFNLDPVFWWGAGLKKNFSNIGMGGEVTIADKFALLSEPVRSDGFFSDDEKVMLNLLEMTRTGESELTLQKMGRKVYRMPTGWMEAFPRDFIDELGLRKTIMMPCDHIDLQAMYLTAEHGLFFSERYYRDNRDFLRRIVDEIKPSVVEILPDEDGLPVNSLPLPGGGVYMDAAAKRSADILRKLGIKVETTSVPYGTWAWGTNAGIHCSTNLIGLPG